MAGDVVSESGAAAVDGCAVFGQSEELCARESWYPFMGMLAAKKWIGK